MASLSISRGVEARTRGLCPLVYPPGFFAFVPGLVGLLFVRASRRIKGNAGMQPERRAGGRGWWGVATCLSALSEIMKLQGGDNEQYPK